MCSWHELISNKPLINQISVDFSLLRNQDSTHKEFYIGPNTWIYCVIFRIIHNKKKGKKIVIHSVD